MKFTHRSHHSHALSTVRDWTQTKGFFLDRDSGSGTGAGASSESEAAPVLGDLPDQSLAAGGFPSGGSLA